MRSVLIALAAVVVAVTAALAAPRWSAPGWYQIADTFVGPFVWAGPFASKDACEQTLPQNDEDADYVCEYLSERPSWDDM